MVIELAARKSTFAPDATIIFLTNMVFIAEYTFVFADALIVTFSIILLFGSGSGVQVPNLPFFIVTTMSPFKPK